MEDKKLAEDSTAEVKSKEPLNSKNIPEMYPAHAESLNKEKKEPKQKVVSNYNLLIS